MIVRRPPLGELHRDKARATESKKLLPEDSKPLCLWRFLGDSNSVIAVKAHNNECPLRIESCRGMGRSRRRHPIAAVWAGAD